MPPGISCSYFYSVTFDARTLRPLTNCFFAVFPLICWCILGGLGFFSMRYLALLFIPLPFVASLASQHPCMPLLLRFLFSNFLFSHDANCFNEHVVGFFPLCVTRLERRIHMFGSGFDFTQTSIQACGRGSSHSLAFDLSRRVQQNMISPYHAFYGRWHGIR